MRFLLPSLSFGLGFLMPPRAARVDVILSGDLNPGIYDCVVINDDHRFILCFHGGDTDPRVLPENH
jgi:hypothetical protein